MSARLVLLVALAVSGPFSRLPAQFGVPGPVINLTFQADPPFHNTCGSQPSTPYNASCTVLNSVGGVMSASAAITPGGPTGSVFTQASFSGALAPQSFVDVESLASLEEEVWFTGGNPNNIFSVAVSGVLQQAQSQFTLSPAVSMSTHSFVRLEVGVVVGAQHFTYNAGAFSSPDETFNVAINASNPALGQPEAFFFRLQSETLLTATNLSVCTSCSADVSASSFADPFVTFYDEAGNDITGDYTLSYIPGPLVVVTPEPATFATTLSGLLSVVGFVNRRRRMVRLSYGRTHAFTSNAESAIGTSTRQSA